MHICLHKVFPGMLQVIIFNGMVHTNLVGPSRMSRGLALKTVPWTLRVHTDHHIPLCVHCRFSSP